MLSRYVFIWPYSSACIAKVPEIPNCGGVIARPLEPKWNSMEATITIRPKMGDALNYLIEWWILKSLACADLQTDA